MGALKRGDDTLNAGELEECIDSIVIGHSLVVGSADVFQVRVLWANARVAKTGGHAVGEEGLALVVLQHVALKPVDDPGLAQGEGGGVLSVLLKSTASGFNAVAVHFRVVQERGEQTNGVAATTHTCHEVIRCLPEHLIELHLCLLTHNRLEVTHHHGVGVGADNTADGKELVGWVLGIGLEGNVHSLLQASTAVGCCHDVGAQNAHADHVGLLLGNVGLSHVDVTLQTEEGCGRGQSYTVLTSTSLGHNLLLAHLLGKQSLSNAVVDFVGASMVKILSLQVDLRTPDLLRKALAVEDGGWAAHKLLEQLTVLPLEFRVHLHLVVCLSDVLQNGLQMGGHKAATVFTEEAIVIGHGTQLNGLVLSRQVNHFAVVVV
eukprot:comp24111_c0_seq1/m.43620 comp24111_c0_seq1/g.43620  ORF comp24111_c0_seq1/g.43620 comp24111_c0_seq1/m.43620 type:complete len:376 (+) comp24111_c0_seq1:537-1664(+)